ncbi:MAG: non-heme iron oxygenase ferredoxin subunit [Xanthobacteraceae bacterium]
MAKDVAGLLPLCRVEDVPPGEMRKLQPPGYEQLAVYHVAGTFFATADTCTHGQASLSEDGALDGYTIECGWHFGAFDIRTGVATASPCQIPLTTYPVQARDGMLYIGRAAACDEAAS